MSQPRRLAQGGLIDRERTLSFTFDGRRFQGHPGDSLASALLAGGVRVVGRSFKYHRPRGIVSAGAEEPNGLVRLGEGADAEPNTRATMVDLAEGLVATSQHRWPSLGFDLLALNGLLAPMFPAGFYYKTFKAPGSAWTRLYEPLIRRAAGLGAAPRGRPKARYEKRHAHCDVLVVGAGPAGLAAALAAADGGLRVIVADEHTRMGGRLLAERGGEIDGLAAGAWAERAVRELAGMNEVDLYLRTTAVGAYDHGLVALVEHLGDGPDDGGVRERLWTVRARQVVLATGAIERGIAFAGNDRPGVMLAGAVRTYLNRFAVAPGRRAVVFTTHDDGWRTAFDLAAAGVGVAAIVDARARPAEALVEAAGTAGIEVIAGHAVTRALGGHGVAAIEVMGLEDDRVIGPARRLDADLLAVSGGWQPAVQLASQSGVKPVWDPALVAFRPGAPRPGERSAGAANGQLTLAAAIEDGFRAGAEAAAALGRDDARRPAVAVSPAAPPGEIMPLFAVPGARRKAFVDLQNDVTVADVTLAHLEGYQSVEHLKRYTTLGMGTDQGKTANLIGLALMAEARGEPIPAVGTTTFRPPTVPVALGTLAGREVGRHFRPLRRSPLHDWHVQADAVFVDAGLWRRPRYYPRDGEDLLAATYREARAVRAGVGLVDVSPLGKIDVQGPDALAFLQGLYCNNLASLAVGKARYALMLREDGMVLDDGTISRLAETVFYVTTTTARAGPVMAHMELHRQVTWPELAVEVTSITDQWAGMALAGPRSRDVLARAVEGAEVDDAALPFMGVRRMALAGCPVLLFRISFSGELAYEIHTPAGFAIRVWQALLDAGETEGIVPYGTEALGTLRIEKGHVAGPELDGRTTPADLGLGRMASRKKNYIGRAAQDRAAVIAPDRLRLVGLIAKDGRTPIRPGAQILTDPTAPPPMPVLGHVTSADYSPTLDRPIALALIQGGPERQGQTLTAAYPLKNQATEVVVTDPVFVDPEGTRLRG